MNVLCWLYCGDEAYYFLLICNLLLSEILLGQYGTGSIGKARRDMNKAVVVILRVVGIAIFLLGWLFIFSSLSEYQASSCIFSYCPRMFVWTILGGVGAFIGLSMCGVSLKDKDGKVNASSQGGGGRLVGLHAAQKAEDALEEARNRRLNDLADRIEIQEGKNNQRLFGDF